VTQTYSAIYEQLYDNPTIAKIAGIEAQVLLGWRRRHDFLGGMQPGKQGSGGYLHSLIQALVAVAVAVMVRAGTLVIDAVSAETQLTVAFTLMLTDDKAPTFFAFRPKGRDLKAKSKFFPLNLDADIRKALDQAEGSLLVIDLHPISEMVLKKLRVRQKIRCVT
jgi:hypothetical protein